MYIVISIVVFNARKKNCLCFLCKALMILLDEWAPHPFMALFSCCKFYVYHESHSYFCFFCHFWRLFHSAFRGNIPPGFIKAKSKSNPENIKSGNIQEYFLIQCLKCFKKWKSHSKALHINHYNLKFQYFLFSTTIFFKVLLCTD